MTIPNDQNSDFRLNVKQRVEGLAKAAKQHPVTWLAYNAKVSPKTARAWINGTIKKIDLANLGRLGQLLSMTPSEMLSKD